MEKGHVFAVPTNAEDMPALLSSIKKFANIKELSPSLVFFPNKIDEVVTNLTGAIFPTAVDYYNESDLSLLTPTFSRHECIVIFCDVKKFAKIMKVTFLETFLGDIALFLPMSDLKPQYIRVE